MAATTTSDVPLEVQLGQLLTVGFRGATADEAAPFIERIRRYHLGGIWLTDADSPMGRAPGNVRSPDQLRQLIADLQSAARVPLLVTIDVEGGTVNRLKEEFGFPRFPAPQDVGERDDLAYTREQATQMARMLRELGINMNLAPVVDLNTNPDNPIIGRRGRAYSADPSVVIRHAAAFIRAHHEQNIMCVLKHFPGHGSSTTDSHLGMVDVTTTWSEADLAPYRALLAEGLVDAVLSAHVFLRQYDDTAPATLSPRIMTGLLREELGFDGVVLTDDMNMGAIGRYFSPADALARAMNAGVDIILHGNVLHYDEHIVEKTIGQMHALVESGAVPRERVRESYERVMRLKARFGLI